MNSLINTNIRFSHAGLFSTEDDWIHPRRIEKTYEIICVTRGTVCIYEEDRVYVAQRGQAILLSPHTVHGGSEITRDVGFYWVHFTVESGSLPFEKRFFERFESTYLFRELLHYNNLPKVPDYAVNSLLVHILSELCFISERDTQRYNSLAEQIYELIRTRATAELTVKSVADSLGYSPDHINRICKKYHGVGAGELINRFLLSYAKSLLCNTSKYVKEIASDLKFPNDKAFIGYFKYHEGCSPTEFRNRFGKIHMNH